MEEKNPKSDILKKAKNLSKEIDNLYKNIYIGPDLSMEERERNRKLRQELREKRDGGESGWFIRAGRLVKQDGNPHHRQRQDFQQ